MNFGRYNVEAIVKILSDKHGLKGKEARVIELTRNGWHTVDYNGKLYLYRGEDLYLVKDSPFDIYQPYFNNKKVPFIRKLYRSLSSKKSKTKETKKSKRNKRSKRSKRSKSKQNK